MDSPQYFKINFDNEKTSFSKFNKKFKEGIFLVFHKILYNHRSSFISFILQYFICYLQMIYFTTQEKVFFYKDAFFKKV